MPAVLFLVTTVSWHNWRIEKLIANKRDWLSLVRMSMKGAGVNSKRYR